MPFAAVPARSTAFLRSSNAARQIWASHNRGRTVCSSGGASGAMEPDVLAAVQAIHASPTKAVFAVTGGGAQARRTLLALGRASVNSPPLACMFATAVVWSPGCVVAAVRAWRVGNGARSSGALLSTCTCGLPGARARQVCERRYGPRPGAASLPQGGASASARA